MSFLYTKLKDISKIYLSKSTWNELKRINSDIELYFFAIFIFPLRYFTKFVGPLRKIHNKIECGHSQKEIIEIMAYILSTPKSTSGVFVEAGCWKGGSSAKLSLACSMSGRDFKIFDSFEGIPSNIEDHGVNIYGKPTDFPEGSYSGSIDEVKGAVKRFGKINCCEFIPGWFEDTMPGFSEQICGAFLDVDLENSMKTCLKYLYPLLQPGCSIYTHDGHLPLIIALLRNQTFWIKEVGATGIPPMDGLGTKKLVRIQKISQGDPTTSITF